MNGTANLRRIVMAELFQTLLLRRHVVQSLLHMLMRLRVFLVRFQETPTLLRQRVTLLLILKTNKLRSSDLSQVPLHHSVAQICLVHYLRFLGVPAGNVQNVSYYVNSTSIVPQNFILQKI